MDENGRDDTDVNRKLFESYKNAQSEEEYAEMVLSELGDPDFLSTGGDDEQYNTSAVPKEKANTAPANYMQPTMASVLPPFLGGEVERVRNSYRTGSYNSIKQLPATLQPGQIRQYRKSHITENLLLNSNNVFKPASNKNEPFQRPEYIGTDFDKQQNLHKYLLEEEKVHTDSLSRKPFVITSRLRSKTEDIFYDPEYRFPGMGPGTGLKRLESMVRGNDDDDKIILEPGYVLQNKLNVGSGLLVKEWITKIHAKLVRDWPQYQFRVKFTKSNELIVQFIKPPHAPLKPGDTAGTAAATAPGQLNVIFPPPNNALNKYMHTLAAHGLASSFGLKKRGDRWNIYEVEYLSANGSLDGTIPTYGTDPNSPRTAALRRSSSQDAASRGSNTPKASGKETPAGRTVRWFSKADVTAGTPTASIKSGGSGSAAGTPMHGILHKQTFFAATGASAGAQNNIHHHLAGIVPGSGGDGGADKSNSVSPTAAMISLGATPRSVTFAADNNNKSPQQPPSGSPTNAGAAATTAAATTANGGVGGAGGAGSTNTSPGTGASPPPEPPGPGEQNQTKDLRPPRIDTKMGTFASGSGSEAGSPPPGFTYTDDPNEAHKVYYLTFAFYAPWIHTSHMNVRRAVGFGNRVKARNYGEKYHNKYSLKGDEGRTRLNTEESMSTVDGSGGKEAGFNIYESAKSGDLSAATGNTPQAQANRFLTGFTRDMKYNS